MKAAYVWEELYKAAILETDDTKLPNCVQAAMAAIDARLYEWAADCGSGPALISPPAMRTSTCKLCRPTERDWPVRVARNLCA